MSEVEKVPTIGVDIFGIQVGHLEGKILTIVDASYSDREQREAVKDLVRKMFREQRRHVETIAYKTSEVVMESHILQEAESNV
jgi:hypothetical protein